MRVYALRCPPPYCLQGDPILVAHQQPVQIRLDPRVDRRGPPKEKRGRDVNWQAGGGVAIAGDIAELECRMGGVCCAIEELPMEFEEE